MIKLDSHKKLAENLGMPIISKQIYMGKNHSPEQLYRNCVHPETGKMILDCAMGVIRNENVNQTTLFKEDQ